MKYFGGIAIPLFLSLNLASAQNTEIGWPKPYSEPTMPVTIAKRYELLGSYYKNRSDLAKVNREGTYKFLHKTMAANDKAIKEMLVKAKQSELVKNESDKFPFKSSGLLYQLSRLSGIMRSNGAVDFWLDNLALVIDPGSFPLGGGYGPYETLYPAVTCLKNTNPPNLVPRLLKVLVSSADDDSKRVALKVLADIMTGINGNEVHGRQSAAEFLIKRMESPADYRLKEIQANDLKPYVNILKHPNSFILNIAKFYDGDRAVVLRERQEQEKVDPQEQASAKSKDAPEKPDSDLEKKRGDNKEPGFFRKRALKKGAEPETDGERKWLEEWKNGAEEEDTAETGQSETKQGETAESSDLDKMDKTIPSFWRKRALKKGAAPRTEGERIWLEQWSSNNFRE